MNGGSSWSNVTPSGSLAPSPENISRIAIDPTDENHIIISISGYNSNKKLMESNNGGVNWTNLILDHQMFLLIVSLLVQHQQVSMGTDIGVFYKSISIQLGQL